MLSFISPNSNPAKRGKIGKIGWIKNGENIKKQYKIWKQQNWFKSEQDVEP